jgi:predicted amidophosphoribosyltransferase
MMLSRRIEMASSAALRVRQGIAAFGQAAMDFLYPPACALCEVPLFSGHPAAQAESGHLCPDCSVGLTSEMHDRCRRCSAPVGPWLDTQSGCVHCQNDPFAFEQALSLGVYEDRLREACIAAKHGNGALTVACADLFWRQSAGVLRAARVDVVIPVPHHWTERVARRQLPPETFARALARHLAAPLEPQILIKTRRTPAQTDLSPTDRRANLRNAFTCRNANLNGATVLLTDDVLTTGTTAHRCSLELVRSGAARILVAVVARGLGRPTAPS